MTLRQKTVMAIAVTLVSIIGALYLISNAILSKRFAASEAGSVLQELRWIDAQLDRELKSFSSADRRLVELGRNL